MARMTEEQILAALRPDALAPADIARKSADVGAAKAALSPAKAFALAVMAGVFISLGAAFMLVIKADTELPFALSQLLSGLVFSVGLFMVVTAGAELFTGNSLMVVGYLERRYGPVELMRSWVLVYAGNLAGALLTTAILALAGFSELGGGAVGAAAASVAVAKTGLAPVTTFFRGILCNVLVCIAVWMGFAARTVCDKLAVCVLPVAAFVACGYEHCVANMLFIPFGILCGAEVGAAGLLSNLIFSTAGNLAGGVGLVACAYWFAYLRADKN